MKLKTWSKWFVVLGGLEVGFMAFGFDLVGSLLGSWPMLVKLVYILVLASSLWGAWSMLMKKK